MLISTFSFALMNVVIKKLEAVPPLEIVFFRCLFSALFCLIGLRSAGVDWLGTNRLFLFLRGAFGTAALYFFFLTIQNVPLASAVTVQYLSPIFTTLIAVFWLKERVKLIQYAFFAVSFGGVFFIKGFDASFPLVYLIAGIVSAICSGVAYVLVRSLRGREHALVVVLHFQLVGIIVGAVACFFEWHTPNLTEAFFLLLTGITTQFGQVYLTKALQAGEIAKTSILNYAGIIYALFFGYFFFDEAYSLQTLFGIILVIGGVLLSVFHGKRNIEPDENTVG